ncbi:MAG: hypothetical protein ABIR68_14090 [Ilumatobacteraceae bacterium]
MPGIVVCATEPGADVGWATGGFVAGAVVACVGGVVTPGSVANGVWGVVSRVVAGAIVAGAVAGGAVVEVVPAEVPTVDDEAVDGTVVVSAVEELDSVSDPHAAPATTSTTQTTDNRF